MADILTSHLTEKGFQGSLKSSNPFKQPTSDLSDGDVLSTPTSPHIIQSPLHSLTSAAHHQLNWFSHQGYHPSSFTFHPNTVTTGFRQPAVQSGEMTYTRKRSTGGIELAKCHACHRQFMSLSFLDLPAEIRNKIYDLLFAGYVLIYRSHPVRERLENPQAIARLHLACHRIYSWSAGTHFYIAPGLLRVCRQVHEEATVFLYGNTTFRLESVFTVNKFLNIVPAADAIRKLELRHSTYGEPRLTEDRKWKHQHDKKWMNTCRRIAENMTSLEYLKLELRICDWPTQLNLAAAWAKPLLVLKGSTGIHYVEVTLIHDAFNKQRLQAAANVVAQAIRTRESKVRPELTEMLQNRGHQAARRSRE